MTAREQAEKIFWGFIAPSFSIAVDKDSRPIIIDRIAEALEAYRWIRREDPGYRDVANRINHLSSRRSLTGPQKSAPLQSGSRIGDMLKNWQGLLTSPK